MDGDDSRVAQLGGDGALTHHAIDECFRVTLGVDDFDRVSIGFAGLDGLINRPMCPAPEQLSQKISLNQVAAVGLLLQGIHHHGFFGVHRRPKFREILSVESFLTDRNHPLRVQYVTIDAA